jgi:hypothetical protein
MDELKLSGTYTQAPGSNSLAMQQCGLTDRYFDDADILDPAACAFYLVTGVSTGVESSLGQDSDEYERPNDNPCP